jgi:hypothetical protein
MNSQNTLAGKAAQAPSTASSPEPTSLVQFQKPAKSAIGNIAVWNMKPIIPLGQMLSLKDMFKPVYTLVKNGRTEKLLRSDRPKESWELSGIVMRGVQPRALMYNSGLKIMKNAGVGDQIDEQLIVKGIDLGKVTLEAKDSKKPQLFELHLFNTQKDIYALKRKNP